MITEKITHFYNHVKSEEIWINDKREYTQTGIIVKLQSNMSNSKYVDPPYAFNPDDWR